MTARFLGAALVALFGFLGSAAADTIAVTDLAGRRVELDRPVSRFIISEGRTAELLALLRPDQPMRGVVGMMTTIGDVLPGLEAQLVARDPGVAEIPLYGLKSGGTASAEKIISLAPELAILGLQDHGPGPQNAELIAQLEKAGIKVAFIDFRLDPLKNTAPSIALVGRLLGAEARADAFIAARAAAIERIQEGLAGVETRPRVFFQAHVGRFPCCVGFADGMLGPFVGVAGGENIAGAAAPGPVGRHSPEFLLTENPDVLIGTASGTAKDAAAGAPFLTLGDGVSPELAASSMAAAFGGEAYQALDATANKSVFALWHNFYNSPFNHVALEALAGWIHPEALPDADPQASIVSIYRDFLGFELDGVYAARLD